jgi:hypothetical protein
MTRQHFHDDFFALYGFLALHGSAFCAALSADSQFLLAQSLLPITILRIAGAKGEDRIGQTPALALARWDAHQHGAIAAAFDLPDVRVHRLAWIGHGRAQVSSRGRWMEGIKAGMLGKSLIELCRGSILSEVLLEF